VLFSSEKQDYLGSVLVTVAGPRHDKVFAGQTNVGYTPVIFNVNFLIRREQRSSNRQEYSDTLATIVTGNLANSSCR
jgi:hypothetical protein